MNPEKSPKASQHSVLIAVDGSRPSMQAVDYTVHMTRLIKDLGFVILYVLPQTPPLFRKEAETDGQMKRRLKALEKANQEKGLDIVNQAKEHLLSRGIPAERIETRLRKRHSGLAKDIINEGELGRFDALVVGRRGLTWSQELFMGSVSNQLIQHASNIPLWMVDGKVLKPKVLAAVDGSEASLRAVDHIAFMLGHNPEAVVDFLHVTPKLQSYCSINLTNHQDQWAVQETELESMEEEFLREDSVCIDDFNHRAVKILKQAGFDQKRIKVEEREVSLGVARTIIKAAQEGGYGTIVVGRRGMGKSSFLGSVSDRVIRRAANLAVWVVN